MATVGPTKTAKIERLTPRQVDLDIGERVRLDMPRRSTNIYLVDETPDWEESDLHDLWRMSEIKSIPLTREGRALVDIYVYRNNEDRELLTNVQAYIETVDDKPTLVKLSGTGARSISRSEIEALLG